MPEIKKICTITGKEFSISEQEQELRKKFGVELPDIHPYERLRYLFSFENYYSLYARKCDLCQKDFVSVHDTDVDFPVYCMNCWYSDKWTPPQLDLDLDRSFFEQMEILSKTAPRLGQLAADPMENSDYSNACGSLKNCYMIFNANYCENCYYSVSINNDKDSIDLNLSDKNELSYECLLCNGCYQVFWSEFLENCRDCYFLYDCVDCHNCALSTGLRHKANIFLNEQLTKEEYDSKIKDLKSGNYQTVIKYKKQFEVLKKDYKKKFILGVKNEDVLGNMIYNSKKIENSFLVHDSESCVNSSNVRNAKDCLDIASFGVISNESCYSCCAIGLQVMNLKFCTCCFSGAHDLEYCIQNISSHDCFGCIGGTKNEYKILNKQYTEEEYKETVAKLKEKMKERGEYGQPQPQSLNPFAYNESIANMIMPLTREEAEKLGYKWKEKKIPEVPQDKIYQPKDSISDENWEDIKGKFVICEKSKRPFKIIEQEFNFYKKYNIPLPRIHPEVRMLDRYPSDLLFNLHDAKCSNCQENLQTSMPESDEVLCEKCYQEAVY